jgi:hypothetical protein
MDSLDYPISGLTVNADYHQGNLVWNSNSSAYETWTDAHYKLGYYSVSAPQDGGGVVTLAGVVLNSTTSVTVTSTAGLSVGQTVAGAGVPAGATIASITSGTVFVLSAAATTSSASGTYTAGNNSARYSATTPAGVQAAGAYDVTFRRHVDGTAANDVPIGSGESGPNAAEGDGTVAVDHNTGGADNLRYVLGSTGVSGGVIRAYLTSDYTRGSYIERGRSITGDDGRWLAPMYLTHGLGYTLTFSKPGAYQTSTAVVTA